MQFAAIKILIFARAPEQGKVKSRLAAAIGAAKACQCYEQLLDNTFQAALAVAACPVICYTTDCHHPYFDQWRKQGIGFFAQK